MTTWTEACARPSSDAAGTVGRSRSSAPTWPTLTTGPASCRRRRPRSAGPIDILVNNAAAGIHQLSAEIPLRRRRIMFEVNLQAPIDLAQAVIPMMTERRRGWIVNLSSGGARLIEGPPFSTSVLGTTNGTYASTKAALNRYTNVLGAELFGTGVRVNTVEPDDPVATEGAIAHLGDGIDRDRYEPIEVMVEGIVALCDCSARANRPCPHRPGPAGRARHPGHGA